MKKKKIIWEKHQKGNGHISCWDEEGEYCGKWNCIKNKEKSKPRKGTK